MAAAPTDALKDSPFKSVQVEALVRLRNNCPTIKMPSLAARRDTAQYSTAQHGTER